MGARSAEVRVGAAPPRRARSRPRVPRCPAARPPPPPLQLRTKERDQRLPAGGAGGPRRCGLRFCAADLGGGAVGVVCVCVLCSTCPRVGVGIGVSSACIAFCVLTAETFPAFQPDLKKKKIDYDVGIAFSHVLGLKERSGRLSFIDDFLFLYCIAFVVFGMPRRVGFCLRFRGAAATERVQQS